MHRNIDLISNAKFSEQQWHKEVAGSLNIRVNDNLLESNNSLYQNSVILNFCLMFPLIGCKGTVES